MGRHQLRLLKFAIKYRGWHDYGTDQATVRAVYGLVKLGILELSDSNGQFRLRYEP